MCHLVAGKRAHMTSLECLSPLQETKSFSLSDEDPVTFLFSLFCVVCLLLKLVPEKKHSCSAHFSLISKFYLFFVFNIPPPLPKFEFGPDDPSRVYLTPKPGPFSFWLTVFWALRLYPLIFLCVSTLFLSPECLRKVTRSTRNR